MTQYLKRFCWLTCTLLTALVAVYGFVPTAQAQQAAGSGVGVQAQSASCTTQIETVEDRLREAEELITKIRNCNDQEKVLSNVAAGTCVYPDELSHSWSGTTLTVAGVNKGNLKGATGDKGPDATCPTGTCVCPNGNCEQADCYVDPDDGGGNVGVLPCSNPEPQCSHIHHRKCPVRICERMANPRDPETAICVYAYQNTLCP